MIKNYSIIVLLLVSFNLFSQKIYFNTGKNFTKYNYKDASGSSSAGFQSGTGDFYEIGIIKPLGVKNVFYEYGIALNEYNAMADSHSSTYRWNTQYLGLHGGLSYALISNQSSSKHEFSLLASTALNVSTIIYGKQEITGNFYDIKSNKEFSGMLLEPTVGISAKYAFSSFGAVTLGYNYCYSTNISNSSSEKVSFNTNQIKFGINFSIN